MITMTSHSLKVTVIVWHSTPGLTLTYFVDESQVGFNWCWLMLIPPLVMYLSSTVGYYRLVSEAVISLQKQFCLLCAMQRQAGTEKQAIKRATIRFLLMGLMWSLTDARTSRHLAVCELCAAAFAIMVSRKWAEALCAVSRGSWPPCCCDMFVGKRGGGICTVTMCKDHGHQDLGFYWEWQMSVVVVHRWALLSIAPWVRGFSSWSLPALPVSTWVLFTYSRWTEELNDHSILLN